MAEIHKNQAQMDKNVNITGNFGKLNLQKQSSTHNNHNFSALKLKQQDSNDPAPQAQMFTSMSDIGFPAGKKIKKEQAEILTTD